jgi:hypothetical protein
MVHYEYLEKCVGLYPFGKKVIELLDQYRNLRVVQINTTAVGKILWIGSYHGDLCMPLPDTFENFMVCLHEIGHGAGNYQSAIHGKLMAEYYAECWALKKAKELGFNYFRNDMKYYVQHRVVGNMLECMRHENRIVWHLSDLPPNVFKWLCIEFHKNGKYKVEWENGMTLYLWKKDEMLTLYWKG